MYLPLFLLVVAAFLMVLNMKAGKSATVGKFASYVGMWGVLAWAVIAGVQAYG